MVGKGAFGDHEKLSMAVNRRDQVVMAGWLVHYQKDVLFLPWSGHYQPAQKQIDEWTACLGAKKTDVPSVVQDLFKGKISTDAFKLSIETGFIRMYKLPVNVPPGFSTTTFELLKRVEQSEPSEATDFSRTVPVCCRKS